MRCQMKWKLPRKNMKDKWKKKLNKEDIKKKN